MIAFKFSRRGLAPFSKQAGSQGFVALMLEGKDVSALIAEERDPRILAQAVAHARQHNEQFWMEKCARRLAELDPSENGRLTLASVLASVGSLQEARGLLDGIDAAGRSAKLYIETLGVLHAKQGRPDQALACFDRLPGGHPGVYPCPIVLPTAEVMIQGCLLENSLAFISRLHELYPRHMLIRSMLVRCLAYNGDLEQARELAAVPSPLLEQAPEFERRQMREAAGQVLSTAGWNNELFEFARDVIAEDPTHWAMYHMATEAAAFAFRDKDYDEIAAGLPAGQAKTIGGMLVLCRWATERGRIEDARALIEELRERSAALFLNATLYLKINQSSAQEIRAAFDDCLRCGIRTIGNVVSYCMYRYYFDASRKEFLTSAGLLEQYRPIAENNVSFWQTYLRCLVAGEEVDKAKHLYRNLPRGLQTSARLRPFDMYFDVLDGKGGEAQGKWSRFIRHSRHACVNSRTSYPQTISLRYRERTGAVLLFATVYNGMAYLDWFLDHYRKLGVDHFFLTDNASDDGTVEFLSREPDVSLFSNPDSFATSAFGVVWINHQMQRFGVGHWCLHVDMDEGLVYPGCDRGRSLKALTSYLDRQAYGAVTATEIDMYPERLDAPVAENLFSTHHYFDTDYRFARSELPPYIMIQGGIRQRMTGLVFLMTKTPLVRVTPDFRYIECNHYTTHLPVADITAALLHYKFVGDVAKRLDEAIDRGVHFAGALAYRRIRSAANERGWGETLLSSFSRSYEGASSLEAAGLIRTTPGWEAFHSPSG